MFPGSRWKIVKKKSRLRSNENGILWRKPGSLNEKKEAGIEFVDMILETWYNRKWFVIFNFQNSEFPGNCRILEG